MPILRVKEIREMSPEERAKKLNEFRTELLRLKTMIKAGGAVENPARIRELRKAIARILTIENEQKRQIEKARESGKGRKSG
ncbi:MAG: 50S ribosomal protein L29 [Candidatus Bathyarchaeia archaeon]